MEKMTKIAVLMTCYNRVDTTLECLRRLFAQKLPTGHSLDVWLVDDASPDQTGERVKAVFPQVNVIQGTGLLFWCKGMRLAWDKAAEAYDYDFYLWLNDDVKLKPMALFGMIADYLRTKGVIVGKFSSDESEREISYAFGKHYMNGNFVLISKEIYRKVGKICGRYHHQYGDFDYGTLVKKAGEALISSSDFCGVCKQELSKYHGLANKGLFERIKLLWDPLGYDIHDAVLYRYRQNGLFRAICTALHVVYVVLKGK